MCTTLCDKVFQWLATGRWFYLGAPVSSTNKTDRNDIHFGWILLGNHLYSLFTLYLYCYFIRGTMAGTVVQWHGSWIEIYLPVCNQYISPLKLGVCLYNNIYTRWTDYINDYLTKFIQSSPFSILLIDPILKDFGIVSKNNFFSWFASGLVHWQLI
jgi:hypothetical protein